MRDSPLRLVDLHKKTEGDKVFCTDNGATWHITDGFTKEGDLTIPIGNGEYDRVPMVGSDPGGRVVDGKGLIIVQAKYTTHHGRAT